MLLEDGWGKDEITMLVDSQATAAAIRSALQRFANSCGPGSKCIFHYSGHVQMLNPGSRSGFRGEALWPTDNSFIGADELAGYLQKLQGQAWIDIAGCEAAAFDRGLSSSNVLFTASSQETEKSYENPVWKNSIWTGLLVDQAMLHKAGDSNHDGHTSLREAIDYATPRAAQLTARESAGPQHPYMAGGQGTQWFESSGAPPSAAPTRSCFLSILCL